jgi:hypothetical protein
MPEISTFPLARYRFDFTVETPLRLPDYAGSSLRGAFGNALRRITCMTRERDCRPCALYRACPYPQIFETPPPESHSLQKFSQVPNPYVIEPPEWGERTWQPGEPLSFGFVLAGRALAQLPFAVLAWQRAFLHGVGRGDGTAQLARVALLGPKGEETVFTAEEGRIRTHEAEVALTPASQEQKEIRLIFHTPLRLQHNGAPLGPDRLAARDLLVALVRRIALMAEFHTAQPLRVDFAQLAQQAQTVESRMKLQWRDWTRWSNRQQQKMALGGVVGEWALRGDLAPFLPFLQLGQWLHVGKNATFGLGRYEIITSSPRHAAGKIR